MIDPRLPVQAQRGRGAGGDVGRAGESRQLEAVGDRFANRHESTNAPDPEMVGRLTHLDRSKLDAGRPNRESGPGWRKRIWRAGLVDVEEQLIVARGSSRRNHNAVPVLEGLSVG